MIYALCFNDKIVEEDVPFNYAYQMIQKTPYTYFISVWNNFNKSWEVCRVGSDAFSKGNK